ncbi:MAG TPA: response regulator transcription factor, partial [Acidimicrobiia bacterium]|nr:response regulator transcription factor [Acidimicrobiia bacterium]
METVRVLVVSSDGGWQATARELFTGAGFGVDVVDRGANARVAIAREYPAVVLLDLELSDVEGYTVCADLRRAYGDVLPIIVTTTDRVDAHDRIAGLLIGADDYVVRPCDPAELLARVRRHLVRAAAYESQAPLPSSGS